ncbi:MAG: hypothetical protein ACW99U_12655 [Candidatus Thorarchaeota archaeon]|jgi:hypothetical protein
MGVFNPEETVAGLKAVLADTKAKLADNDGWDLGDIKDVFDAVILVVALVEQALADIKAGGDDKKAVAAETLDWLINVPGVPDWLEKQIFGLVVDLAVQALNRFKPGWEDAAVVDADTGRIEV